MLRYLEYFFKLVFKIHMQEDMSTFRRHETGLTSPLCEANVGNVYSFSIVAL